MNTVTYSTALAKVDQESGVLLAYPVYMPQVQRENPTWSFLVVNDEEFINFLGYQVVVLTERPTTPGVVIERDPLLIDGKWVQQWEVRPYSPEELESMLVIQKASTIELIATRLQEALAIGFEFNFGTEEAPVLGNVQLRGTDRVNIIGSGLRADRLVAAGTTGNIMPFRTYENTTMLITPEQMTALSDDAYDAYLVFINMSWDLKDATTAATTAEEVPVVPDVLVLPEDWRTLLVRQRLDSGE